MARITETVHFSGRVQGVGFRASTQRLARDSGVVGFVRNLADGRVEMIATAESEAISRLIDRLNGLYGDGIVGIDRLPKPEVEEFSDFAVRR
jgi:acylphosphatase